MKIKFGQHVKFSEARYGGEDLGRKVFQHCYRGKYLGDIVRGTIGTYTIAGIKYFDEAVIFWNKDGVQHKAPYLFLFPGGPPPSGAGGDKLKAARIIYKTFSAAQKAAYDLKAREELLTDGFNIYLREYMLANP